MLHEEGPRLRVLAPERRPDEDLQVGQERPETRCRKKDATGARAHSDCVRACASCPSEGACVDDTTWSHTNNKNKKISCAKVARNPPRRCEMTGAKEHCRATCRTCEL